jgi:hypothetical protein
MSIIRVDQVWPDVDHWGVTTWVQWQQTRPSGEEVAFRSVRQSTHGKDFRGPLVRGEWHLLPTEAFLQIARELETP